MSGTKKLPKYVTYQTLARFAAAADATFTIRLNAMEERLRDEFGASRILAALDEPVAIPRTPGGFGTPESMRAAGFIQGEDGSWYPGGTSEGNHLAPTPAEGAE